MAGLLAAGAALAGGELVAGMLGATSLVVSVADRIVDHAPGAFIRFGIETFGSNDKPALLVSIVLVCLAIGAALGPLAARLPVVGAVALAGFGLVGVLAEAGDPLGSQTAALAIGGGAAVTGYLVLRVLLDAGTLAEASPAVAIPGRGTGSRRRFLAFAGATAGGASVAAFAGRRLGPSVDVEEQRAGIELPAVAGAVAGNEAGLNVPGISPLITPNEEFYRIDTAFAVPRVDATTWRLAVTGMVATPFELSFDELLAMPPIEEPVTLTCVSNPVGGDLVGNAVWRGVPLADLLERAGVSADASQLVGRSVDGFTVGFPTEIALDGRAAMVAYAMNGEPLPAAHGFPARLLVPGLYGYVSATKWLSEIELTTLDAFDAYWIPRGWSKDGPIKTQSRIDTPRLARTLKPGPVPIAGVAWGGVRGVSRVEVRVTPRGGEPAWHQATLGPAMSSSTWRQWVVEDWEPGPGEYVLEARATDGEGHPQTEEERPPAPDGATGLHMIFVRVET